jgi:DNA-binding MarR family transcriptional regulator
MQETPDPDARQRAQQNPIDLGSLPLQLGYALRRAQATVLQDLQRRLAAHDIRQIQFLMLQVLRHNPGLRQTQLSHALGVKRTNLVPLLDELERRGLAERRRTSGDRRSSAVFLTAQGLKMLDQLERIMDQHEDRYAARLGPEGKHQLLALLQRLSDPAFDPGG